MKLAVFSFRNMKLAAITVGLFFYASMPNKMVSADVLEHFDTVATPLSGEFAWDDFSGSYAAAHNTQEATGIGSATLSVNEGGLITGTSNLYSLNSVATWSHSLSGLKSDESIQSLVIQVATTANLTDAQFSIGGVNPDEFIDLGQRASIGGFAYNFYWAEWSDLSANGDLSVVVQGTSVHQSFAGSKVSYVNANSATDIAAVPEPGSVAVLLLGAGVGLFVRRRK